MKGRTPPREPRRVPTAEGIAARIRGKPGLFILAVGHNDGCPTLRSQNGDDCTCGNDLEISLRDAEGKRVSI